MQLRSVFQIVFRRASSIAAKMAHSQAKLIRLPSLNTEVPKNAEISNTATGDFQTSKLPKSAENSIGNEHDSKFKSAQQSVENGYICHTEGSCINWEDAVSLACKSLSDHNVVAVPTDTIYGIAALAQSTDAVDKLYDIKNRDTSKPISISVGDVLEIKKWGKVTISDELMRELLPGPVTVVFERTPSLNPQLNPNTNLVGIRVPDSGFVRDVAKACGEPLALTSANRSSGPSSLSVQEFSDLWPQLALVFNGGLLGKTAESRLGSTVVDLSKPGTYSVIRQGSAYAETVDKLIRHGLKGKENNNS